MFDLIEKNLKKRYAKESRFKVFGALSIFFAIAFLVVFLSVIVNKGHKAFYTHRVLLEVDFSGIDSSLDKQKILEETSYRSLIRKAIGGKFSHNFVSDNADFVLRDFLEDNFDLIGKKKAVWLDVSSKVDIYLKYGIGEVFSEKDIAKIDDLVKSGQIKSFFNGGFFKNADSREPESAGIAASLIGSFFVMIVFLLFAFPIAVMCALYLEEFAPKNKITDLIEISINNLAAIPSIIYGLLGLTLYLQFMNLPRSSALVGGMTLFMLVLPIVIIATRNTIRTIPQSIRDGAIALGASKMQVVLHHILPLSIPGIMTGTILAISRALGETAPLLMIGMVAFIADVPGGFTDPTTVLPVQIYLWSDSPEIGFAEKTAAAIIVLLGFLILFNLVAIVLRKKFERKW